MDVILINPGDVRGLVLHPDWGRRGPVDRQGATEAEEDDSQAPEGHRPVRRADRRTGSRRLMAHECPQDQFEPEPERPGSAMMPLTWAGTAGAGDGNRTRTVSLEDRFRLP
ncbi:hypothetical protein [Plantactinospora sp. DSM 117369]